MNKGTELNEQVNRRELNWTEQNEQGKRTLANPSFLAMRTADCWYHQNRFFHLSSCYCKNCYIHFHLSYYCCPFQFIHSPRCLQWDNVSLFGRWDFWDSGGNFSWQVTWSRERGTTRSLNEQGSRLCVYPTKDSTRLKQVKLICSLFIQTTIGLNGFVLDQGEESVTKEICLGNYANLGISISETYLFTDFEPRLRSAIRESVW